LIPREGDAQRRYKRRGSPLAATLKPADTKDSAAGLRGSRGSRSDRTGGVREEREREWECPGGGGAGLICSSLCRIREHREVEQDSFVIAPKPDKTWRVLGTFSEPPCTRR
jgi:hypothetical protein